MKRTCTGVLINVVFIVLSYCLTPALWSQTVHDCDNSTSISHVYPSGAIWSMCASIDNSFGLHLTQLHYHAPGDSDRQTFAELHLAGVLEHIHDETEERSVLTNSPFGGETFVSFNANSCPGEVVEVPPSGNICTHSYADKILAKFQNEAVVQSHSWDVIASASDGQDTWEVIVSFGEEGSVTPTLNRSGVVHRYTSQDNVGSIGANNPLNNAAFATNSTVLATWRIVPGMGPSSDAQTVQQLDFTLRPDLGNRRPMATTTLTVETLRQVNREQFRRWLVLGGDGAGYSVDVQNNGFQYRSPRYNWALFDIAVTAYQACEQTTLRNFNDATDCGESLEDYVNGEPLENTTPVIWFSQSMPIVITAEDLPLMQTRSLSFDLVPFDWTANTPFAPNSDPISVPDRSAVDNGL